MERLVALGKLWALVALFHPYLAYRAADWNEALVLAIDAFEAASSDDDYLQVVDSMLRKLEDCDSYACVQQDYGTPELPEAVPRQLFSIKDSVAIFDLKQLQPEEILDIKAELLQRFDDLSSASTVLFDLRRYGAPWVNVDLVFDSEISSYLTKEFIYAPAYRSRLHSGFASTKSDGYYFSAFVTREAETFYYADDHLKVPVYFLIDSSSRLPGIALGLHCSYNHGGIICEGAHSIVEIAAARSIVYLPGNITAYVRLEELIYPSGLASFFPDKLITGSDDDIEVGLREAMQWINGGSAGTTESIHPSRTVSFSTAFGGIIRPAFYPENIYPERGYRLLAAFRIWYVIHYFFLGKDLMDENWDDILVDSLIAFGQAADAREYGLAVSAMVKHLQDSHVFVSGKVMDDFYGLASPPVLCAIIENKVVITKIRDGNLLQGADLKIGEIIVSVDGKNADSRRAELARYLCASTADSLDRKVADLFLSGADASVASLSIEDFNGKVRTISLQRRDPYSETLADKIGDDLAAFYKLENENLGYANLNHLTEAMVPEMFEAFRDTRGIIFDMRGYPKYTMNAIAARLCAEARVAAVRFKRPVVASPLRTYKTFDEVEPQIQTFVQYLYRSPLWRYEGKTVMLIDASAQSQAEQTAMFLKVANGTVFIGSPTAGTVGTVTDFDIPGEINITFTGDLIEYADGTRVQKLGLTPDILVRPTIAGIRAGKDEVLDAAIEYLKDPLPFC